MILTSCFVYFDIMPAVPLNDANGARSILACLHAVPTDVLCREAPYFLSVLQTRDVLCLLQKDGSETKELSAWCKKLRDLLTRPSGETKNTNLLRPSAAWWTGTLFLKETIRNGGNALLLARFADWADLLLKILKVKIRMAIANASFNTMPLSI